MAKIINKKDAIKALNPNNPRIQVTYHDTKKGMGGHIRPMDWNYYPRDNPNLKPNSKKKRRRNTNVSTGSSSLKINRSSSGWVSNLNL